MLEGIGKQIAHNLDKHFHVNIRHKRFRDVTFQITALQSGGRKKPMNHSPEDLGQIRADKLRLDPAAIHLPEIKQLIHQIHQTVCVVPYDKQVVIIRIRFCPMTDDFFQRHLHQAQRCSYLVGYV